MCQGVKQRGESSPSSSDDESEESRRMIKIKASHSHKGPYDFDLLVPVQENHSAHNVRHCYYLVIKFVMTS